MSSTIRVAVCSCRSLVGDLLACGLAVPPFIVVSVQDSLLLTEDADVAVVDAAAPPIFLGDLAQLRAAVRGVVLISAAQGDYLALRGEIAGVSAFVHEDDSMDSLREAVHSAATGVAYEGAGFALRRRHPVTAELTPREKQVFEFAAAGISDGSTGESLGISSATVETHRANLMRKLGVRDWAQLSILGVLVGAVSPRDFDVFGVQRRSARRKR